MEKKKLFKIIMWIRLPFTIYLLISLLIVPGIEEVQGKSILGAHRGDSINYEENTLEAFESAVNNSKYEFIEFDVTYTEDDKKVIFHQNNIMRIPKKLTIIPNATYGEVQEKFEFHIPTYEETMSVIGDKKPLNIEIKSTGDFEKDKRLTEEIIKDCKERKIVQQVMISSISEEIIFYVEENYPEIKTGKVYWVNVYSIIPLEIICKEVYDTPADYVLLHGYNLHNYENLIEYKPEEKGLMFWYFTDEVYICDNQKFWE